MIEPITNLAASIERSDIMGRVVVVAYKPKPGKFEALKKLMKTHLSILRKQGLVTDRESIIMVAEDETIIEVFEWKSKQAIDDAHNDPVVQKMWARYFEICAFIPATQVKEFSEIFSEFTPIN